jgi:hypothetical protein
MSTNESMENNESMHCNELIVIYVTKSTINQISTNLQSEGLHSVPYLATFHEVWQ